MKKCSTLHLPAVRSLQIRTKTVTWLSDSFTPYTDTDIRYTDLANRYTYSCIRYTDSAIRYTDSDIRYTDSVNRNTDSFIRYTDSTTRYNDSSSRSTAQSRATTTYQNPRSFLVSLSELSVSVVLSLELGIWYLDIGTCSAYCTISFPIPITPLVE